MEQELFEMLLQSMQEANTIKLSNEAREQLEEVLDNPPDATKALKKLILSDEN